MESVPAGSALWLLLYLAGFTRARRRTVFISFAICIHISVVETWQGVRSIIRVCVRCSDISEADIMSIIKRGNLSLRWRTDRKHLLGGALRKNVRIPQQFSIQDPDVFLLDDAKILYKTWSNLCFYCVWFTYHLPAVPSIFIASLFIAHMTFSYKRQCQTFEAITIKSSSSSKIRKACTCTPSNNRVSLGRSSCTSVFTSHNSHDNIPITRHCHANILPSTEQENSKSAKQKIGHFIFFSFLNV